MIMTIYKMIHLHNFCNVHTVEGILSYVI